MGKERALIEAITGSPFDIKISGIPNNIRYPENTLLATLIDLAPTLTQNRRKPQKELCDLYVLISSSTLSRFCVPIILQ